MNSSVILLLKEERGDQGWTIYWCIMPINKNDNQIFRQTYLSKYDFMQN